MSFNFVEKVFSIGSSDVPSPLQFYKRGFVLGGSGASPSWQDIILSGNTALTLTNALANSLNYVKLFGGTEQRNIPTEYTQVAYLGSDSQAYIDTGISGGTDTLEIGCDFEYSTYVNYGAIYGNYISDSDNGIRLILGTRPDAGEVISCLNTICTTTGNLSVLNGNANVKNNTVSNKASFSLNGTSTVRTFLDRGTNNNDNIALFNRSLTTPNTERDIGLKVYKFHIKNNGVLVCNLIPCKRNSDNALGMYDTVSGNFLTNQGTGTFTAGADVVPSPDTPMDIICNNGVLKVSPNLVEFNETRINSSTWDSADKTKGFEVYADVYNKSVGDNMLTNTNTFGVFVPCKQGESISLNFFNYKPFSTRCLYCEITADRKCNTTPQEYDNAGVIRQKTFTLTKSDSIGFIIEWWINSQQTRNYTASNYMIVKGSTPPTKYMPYGQVYTDGTQEVVTDSVGNTASAERLLAVGNYVDTQEVLNGSVTRNVGIKVLDGTENWIDSGFYMVIKGATASWGAVAGLGGFCTHLTVLKSGEMTFAGACRFATDFNIYEYKTAFGVNDITEFKQYLASQYAQGTPVIVVYPLAEPTTETVTAQPLTTQAGTNIVEITQASIDNLELEVSYKATA